MSARRFVDAPAAVRCLASVRLRDFSRAQCGRRGTVGGFTVEGVAGKVRLCRQHADQALQRGPGAGTRPGVRAHEADYPAVVPCLTPRDTAW
jgi:hypothetical protein